MFSTEMVGQLFKAENSVTFWTLDVCFEELLDNSSTTLDVTCESTDSRESVQTFRTHELEVGYQIGPYPNRKLYEEKGKLERVKANYIHLQIYLAEAIRKTK